MIIFLFQPFALEGLSDLGTEQQRQFMSASIAMALYYQGNQRFDHMSYCESVYKKVTAGYVNGSSNI